MPSFSYLQNCEWQNPLLPLPAVVFWTLAQLYSACKKRRGFGGLMAPKSGDRFSTTAANLGDLSVNLSLTALSVLILLPFV